MFRKFVSNLSFSPALVGQLGFYAKRLRKEEATRRIGLIFTALALVVQSFAVFSPPESANAANPDAIVYNSIRNKAELLSIYDRNNDGAGHRDIQQIYRHFGITRQDIVNAHEGHFNTTAFNNSLNFVGRSNWGVSGRYQVAVPGANTSIYSGDWLSGAMERRAVIGQRAIDGEWFAIMLDCGNPVYLTLPPKPVATCTSLTITPINRTSLRATAKSSAKFGAKISSYAYTVKNANGNVVAQKTAASTSTSNAVTFEGLTDGTYTIQTTVATSLGNKTGPSCQKQFTVSPEPRCPLQPDIVASNPDCKPCPEDESIWYKDKDCSAEFVIAKTVSNLTQSIEDANSTTAKPGDRLEYTLTVSNVGKDTGRYVIQDSFSDVFEYADAMSLGGGSITKPEGQENTSASQITWPEVTLQAGQSISKVVNIKIKDTIPALATHPTARQSYDCKITNVFGNTLEVGVECPPEKIVEQVVTELPQTGSAENMIFAGIVLAVVTYFYARARQVKNEVRLIRRDLNAGTI